MSTIRMGEMQAAEGKSNDLREFLLSIIPIITSSDGSIACQLLQDRDDPRRFVMIEVWESAEHHQASAQNIPEEMLAAIRPLLGAAPSGSYYAEVIASAVAPN